MRSDPSINASTMAVASKNCRTTTPWAAMAFRPSAIDASEIAARVPRSTSFRFEPTTSVRSVSATREAPGVLSAMNARPRAFPRLVASAASLKSHGRFEIGTSNASSGRSRPLKNPEPPEPGPLAVFRETGSVGLSHAEMAKEAKAARTVAKRGGALAAPCLGGPSQQMTTRK